jgi:hypothetical protein
VLINARAAQVEMNKIPRSSWHGKGAMRGLRTLALGITLQLASFILAKILQHGH